MFSVALKYFSLLVCVVIFFVNFISCGLQFYKVSLDEDTQQELPYDATDPDSEFYGIHAAAGWRQLPIPFRVGSGFESTFSLTSQEQLQGILRAVKTWEIAVGKQLFEFRGVHKEVQGDTFNDLYTSLSDSVNGHYLDRDWGKTGKSEVVLATTIWENESGGLEAIRTADIRFNSAFYVFGDSLTLQYDDEESKEVVDMESLALHELGHLLGLSHIDEDVDMYSAMNPSLLIGTGLTSRGVSKGDIQRIQKIYGCQAEACELSRVIEKLRDRFSDEESDQDLAGI